MSALFSTTRDESDDVHDGPDDAVLAGTPVVVRRRAGLAALIGAAASAVAIAYLWRASATMTPLDWSLCVGMALVAGYYLTLLVDARTPLAVADDLGVRIRLGDEWRGLPWDAMSQVTVQPRRNLLRDGRLTFVPHSTARAVEGLEGRARRHARLNQKMYGAALAVPVGFTTRVSTSGEPSDDHADHPTGEQGLLAQLTLLSRGTAEVVEVAAKPAAGTKPATEPITERATEQGTGSATEQATEQATGSATEQATEQATGSTSEPIPAPTAEPAAGSAAAPAPPPRWAAGSATSPTETAHPSVPEQVDPTPTAPDLTEGAEEAGLAGIRFVADEQDDTGSTGAASTRLGRARPARRRMLGGIGLIVSRVRKSRRPAVRVDGEVVEVPLDRAAQAEASRQPVDPDQPVAFRETRRAHRAEVTRDVPATGAAATSSHGGGLDAAAGERHHPAGADPSVVPVGVGGSPRVLPISRLGDPVEPLVIDDFVTEPAYDPVIGPEVMAARSRVGLSVDELADRTRIRPHVIESIEVDDFTPCGGDFYARGHLRTLARVLGKDPAPLLAAFEDRYATAPVNARRVFEAELATGMRNNMRTAMGGPNWGLLIGVVLSLVLVWGVVRFFSAEPADLVQDPGPVLNGSAGLESDPGGREADRGGPAAARSVPVVLTAARARSRVVVRDGDGRTVFTGRLVLGAPERLRVTAPVRVRARGPGVVDVAVRGEDRGTVGAPGGAGSRTFR